MNKTAIIYHEDYLLHDSGKFHPERKERLIATINYFKTKGILDFVPILTPKPATEKDILRVHTKEHLDFIKNLSTAGGGVIDSDTLVTKDTFNVAKLAAGGVIIA